MEWKLFASIAGFAVVGISVAASVLIDRDRSGVGGRIRAAGGSSIGEAAAPELEGSQQEGYDHIVSIGGGARALTRELGTGSRGAESMGGRAEDSTVQDKDKGFDNRGADERVSSRW